MQDRQVFSFDRTVATPGGHSYFRCSEGPNKGQWAISDDSGTHPWETEDGVVWVVADQIVEVGANAIALMLTTPDGLSRTLLSPAEAVMVAAMLGLQVRVGDRLFKVTDLGQASTTELQMAHPDGTLVAVGEWITDAEGGSAKYVCAERVDGDVIVTVYPGGSELSTAPASLYDLRVQ